MDLSYDEKSYKWYDELNRYGVMLNAIMPRITDPDIWGETDDQGRLFVLRCLSNEPSERIYSYTVKCQPTTDDPNGRILLLRHPTDKNKIYFIQLEGCSTILDTDPVMVEHPERLVPMSISYHDPIVMHSHESMSVVATRLDQSHLRGVGYGPIIFHGMVGHYIEEDPERYDKGRNVSDLEPLASTVYGIKDVHLIEAIPEVVERIAGIYYDEEELAAEEESPYRVVW